MSDVTKLPSAAGISDPTAKEILGVLTGDRGNPLDRAVTLRDLQEAGIISVSTIAAGSRSKAVVVPPTGFAPDLTVPPSISDLTVTGAYQQMHLSWQKPNMANYAYTQVWRCNVDNLAQAEQIGQSSTTIYTDACGSGKTYYYWVRGVSDTDVVGPFNSGAGTKGETAADVEYLLEQLNGQITESQLWKDLGARIDLIDDAGTLSDTVTARLANLYAEVEQGFTSVEVFNQYVSADQAFAEQVRGLVFVDDSDGRVSALEGVIITADNDRNNTAIRFSTVEADVASNRAAITSEQTARANADSALTTSISSAVSRITSAEAAISTEQTTRANADGALASAVNTLQTSVNGNTASIQTQATSINGLSAQYTVKIDNNGYVSGFGLASNSVYANSGSTLQPTSQFYVRADSFSVGSPGYGLKTPFSVVTTGLNPGVYMDAAFIKRASITNAQIGSLSADRITAGMLTARDSESSKFYGSEFYIGGTATYSYYTDPDGVSRKNGITSVANPNVSLTAAGAVFNAGYFSIYNGASAYAPFQVIGGQVEIKTAVIGDASIETLKLAGEAVTIPGFYNGLSCWHNFAGQRGIAVFSADVEAQNDSRIQFTISGPNGATQVQQVRIRADSGVSCDINIPVCLVWGTNVPIAAGYQSLAVTYTVLENGPLIAVNNPRWIVLTSKR